MLFDACLCELFDVVLRLLCVDCYMTFGDVRRAFVCACWVLRVGCSCLLSVIVC